MQEVAFPGNYLLLNEKYLSNSFRWDRISWVIEGYEGDIVNCVTFGKNCVSAWLQSEMRGNHAKCVRVVRSANYFSGHFVMFQKILWTLLQGIFHSIFWGFPKCCAKVLDQRVYIPRRSVFMTLSNIYAGVFKKIVDEKL